MLEYVEHPPTIVCKYLFVDNGRIDELGLLLTFCCDDHDDRDDRHILVDDEYVGFLRCDDRKTFQAYMDVRTTMLGYAICYMLYAMKCNAMLCYAINIEKVKYQVCLV